MIEYFIPYDGSKPFLFVSYSHADSALVVPFIKRIHDSGYRLWYDEGIPAGNDWPESVRHHLNSAAGMLFFESDFSAASKNCELELAQAEKRGIPITRIPVDFASFEDVVSRLPEDFLATPGDYDTKRNKNRRFSFWTFATVLASMLLVASLYFAYTMTREAPAETEPAVTPVPKATIVPNPGGFENMLNVVSFPDELQENAIRYASGIAEGDVHYKELSSIRFLGFCGNMYTKEEATISYEDGSFSVNGSRVIRGNISDLKCLARIGRIEKLNLIYQNINDISPLGELQLLRTLNISGCDVRTDRPLNGFPSLEEIYIEHCNIQDLAFLDELPSLKKVHVSKDMLPLSFGGGSYEVTVTD